MQCRSIRNEFYPAVNTRRAAWLLLKCFWQRFVLIVLILTLLCLTLKFIVGLTLLYRVDFNPTVSYWL
jgi:hypothetical protein